MIYKEFLKTNPKNIEIRKRFICSYCSRAKDAISISAELGRDRRQIDSSSNGMRAVIESIITNISLESLRDLIESSDLRDNYCDDCNLCFPNEFKSKRKKFKNLVSDLDSNTGILLKKKLEEICDNYLQTSLKLNEDQEGNYTIQFTANNLYQLILIDFVNSFLNKLNEEKNVRKYFLQISKILLSTNSFLTNIEKVRDRYMVEKPFGNTTPDYYRKSEFTHEDIHQVIEKILKEYWLSPRWKTWVYNILIHDIDKRKNLINTFLPDMSNSFSSTRKKRPILEFNKYLRWYKAREEGQSYIDIFDDELDNHIEDWREFSEYSEVRDNNNIRVLSDGRTVKQVERIAINRIKYGVYRLRRRIFKEDK
ncbi:hypothetical protein ACFLQS_00805 [Actinomycetota bacterium]